MASIDIGTQNIQSYAHGWQVAERSVGKDGAVDLRHHRFYPNLQSALLSMLEHRLRESDATSLADIQQLISAHRAELAERFTIKVEVR